MPEAKNKIVREYRSGHVRLTVWEHEGERKAVALTRLYKAQDGKWQRTESFKPQDLLDVVAVCLKANEFLRMEERWQNLSRREGLIDRTFPRKNP
ncbi:MAG: hypothetical protein QXP01_06595 [Candidatus Hadarchaeum sp.]